MLPPSHDRTADLPRPYPVGWEIDHGRFEIEGWICGEEHAESWRGSGGVLARIDSAQRGLRGVSGRPGFRFAWILAVCYDSVDWARTEPRTEGVAMRRTLRLLVAAGTLALLTGLSAPMAAGAGSSATPLWVKHVNQYPGGISNGVRAYLDPAVVQAQAQFGNNLHTPAPAGNGSGAPLNNVQMNDDSYPPMPQNETAVAYSLDDPMIAVAGANDYVSGGTVVMRTTDGGQHWTSTRVIPRVPAVQRDLQRRRPRPRLQPSRQGLLPRPAVLLPHGVPVRGADLQVPGQRHHLDARTARRRRGHQLRLLHRRDRRQHLQRQGVHGRRQQPARAPSTAGSTSPTRASTSTTRDRRTPARSSSPTPTTSRARTPRWPSGATRTSCRTIRRGRASGSRRTSSRCRWWSRAAR